MTVKELVEALSSYDGDAEVVFLRPTHDYWRHMVVNDVLHVDQRRTVWNGYCSAYAPAADDDRPDNHVVGDPPDRTVVVLS